jgi:hypothetical protein
VCYFHAFSTDSLVQVKLRELGWGGEEGDTLNHKVQLHVIEVHKNEVPSLAITVVM